MGTKICYEKEFKQDVDDNGRKFCLCFFKNIFRLCKLISEECVVIDKQCLPILM